MFSPISLVAREQKISLIILNMPLLGDSEMFQSLWKRAELRVCADGGANRLFGALMERASDYVPHVIIGDLDSLSDGVKEFYVERGAHLKHDEDQNDNDFGKAVRETIRRRPDLDIVVLGGLGGRFDHLMCNANVLVRQAAGTGPRIVMYSAESIVCALGTGDHRLLVDLRREGVTCGLLPVCGPTKVTTTGLQWNLDGDTLLFGGLISSSNCVLPSGDSPTSVVTIASSLPLLWSSTLHESPSS